MNTGSFQGIYRRFPKLQLISGVLGASFPFPSPSYLEDVGLEAYQRGEQTLIFKESETLPSYSLENGRIELLENGNRTSLYLATNMYHSEAGKFFDRIALPFRQAAEGLPNHDSRCLPTR